MGGVNGTNIGPEFADSFADVNGRKVHQFASEMANLGFARMTEVLLSMLDSGDWRQFHDGLGTYRFLPGEFDYFLTQQGVNREHVMKGVRDLDAKARLEAAMDERRTGEDGYRRRIAEAREQNPHRPGRPIEPFGLNRAEAKAQVNWGGGAAATHREALGDRVRRYSLTGGRTTQKPSEEAPTPRWVRLRNTAERLPDDDLDALIDALKAERRRRKDLGARARRKAGGM